MEWWMLRILHSYGVAVEQRWGRQCWHYYFPSLIGCVLWYRVLSRGNIITFFQPLAATMIKLTTHLWPQKIVQDNEPLVHLCPSHNIPQNEPLLHLQPHMYHPLTCVASPQVKISITPLVKQYSLAKMSGSFVCGCFCCHCQCQSTSKKLFRKCCFQCFPCQSVSPWMRRKEGERTLEGARRRLAPSFLPSFLSFTLSLSWIGIIKSKSGQGMRSQLRASCKDLRPSDVRSTWGQWPLEHAATVTTKNRS